MGEGADEVVRPNNHLTATNGLGKTTSYTYDGMGDQTSVTVPINQAANHFAATNYQYNALKEVTLTIDALSRQTLNTYDFQGNLFATKDALGNSTSNGYTNGLLVSTTDAAGNTTNYGYDGHGFLNSIQDALGNVTTIVNDGNGNKLSQTVTRTLSNGAKQSLTTSYQYDGNNRLTKTVYPDGSSTQIAYNAIGKVDHTVDQLGRTTAYVYDNNGNLTQTTYPDGTTESKTYDLENHLLTSTDRAGHVTTYTYDGDGRLIKTTYADGSSTSTSYDAAGQTIASTDANGNTTSYAYDDAGQRTSVTDALLHTTTFAYDDAGEQTSMTDALGHTTQSVFDADGRQTKTVYNDQTFSQTIYDTLGRVTSKVDQAGIATSFSYDSLGRLTSVTQSPDGTTQYVISYAYDEVGERVSQTDANGHATSFAYDQLGRRTSRTLPLGMSELFTYDAAGNIQTHTDFNGHTTTYAYDAQNRLLSKTADQYFAQNGYGAAQVSFTYDPVGNRKTMSDASGTTIYSYDSRNRLTSKQTPFGTLSYAYDAAGDVLSITSSNANGTKLTYTYDKLNRLATVTDGTGQTSYSYDAVGNLAGFTYPNGVAHAYSYDTLNRLTNLSVTSPACSLPGAQCIDGDTAGYQYTLGPAGNRTAVTEISGRKVQYGYDNLYRLTSETIANDLAGQNGTLNYSYDAVGNRKQLTSSLSAIPSSGLLFYDANDRTTTDVYDNDGNTINSGGTQDVYDFENHLIQHGNVTAVYDGDGNRVQKTAAGVTTSYLVDTNNPSGYAQVLEELQAGQIVRKYTYGLDLISETQQVNGAWTTSWYQFDGDSGVRALTNATGTVTDTYTYDAFGDLIESTGTTLNNYPYRGQQFDPAVGVYYLRARYYNANVGRFLTEDPDLGNEYDPPSLHQYLYVRNNPVNRIDPHGTFDLVEITVVNGIANTVNSLEANVGQAVMTQLKEGGNSGFTFLLVSGATVLVTALAVKLVQRLLPQLNALRQLYIASVQDLGNVATEMEASGATEEQIARTVVNARNGFKEIARDKMPAALVRLIELRNLDKYGNTLGPTAEQLFEKYGSWSAVTAAAQRTNNFIYYVLNVFDKFL